MLGGIKVSHHLCLPRNLWLAANVLQMYWHTMQPGQAELNSLQLAKVGEEKKKETELN